MSRRNTVQTDSLVLNLPQIIFQIIYVNNYGLWNQVYWLMLGEFDLECAQLYSQNRHYIVGILCPNIVRDALLRKFYCFLCIFLTRAISGKLTFEMLSYLSFLLLYHLKSF